jgi:hypothetical protein
MGCGPRLLICGPFGDISDPNHTNCVETPRLEYSEAKRRLKLGKVKIFVVFNAV